MQKNTSRFSVRFLMPTVAAALVTTIALALSLTWSAQRIDVDTTQREQVLIERAMAEVISQVGYAQAHLAVWDEAVQAYERGDRQWLADYLGLAAFEYYGHSRTIILDGNLKPIVALQEGGEVPPKSFGEQLPLLAPLIENIRSREGRAKISAYRNGMSSTVPSQIDVMVFEGEPAIVGVMPMLPYSDGTSMEPGTEPLFVSVLPLDQEMADYLGDQYLLSSPIFAREPKPTGEWAHSPIVDRDGKTVTWINWRPLTPGARLVTETLPTLLIGLGIAGAIIGFLLRNLRLALKHLRAEREEADHRALHDPLTGLGNRRLFDAELARKMAAISADGGKIALLALDLDRFKQVNDTLGHDAGDALLIEVARRIEARLPAGGTLARLGGDEFSIILSASSSAAAQLAGEIVASLAMPFDLGGHRATIGVSIGIAMAPDMGTTGTKLVSNADEALYRAKNGGRNRYCFYADAPSEKTQADGADLGAAFPSRAPARVTVTAA